MHRDTASTWRLVCLLTLGAFLGLGVTAFATGLLPGDLDVRQALPEQRSALAYHVARVVNEAGTWRGPPNLAASRSRWHQERPHEPQAESPATGPRRDPRRDQGGRGRI
jgi:hypothetical protein